MYYKLPSKEVLKKFDTNSESGLSPREATKRFAKYGPNKILENEGRSLLSVIWRQINNILTYILLLATILSVVAGHYTDAIIIGSLILINVSIGSFHEYRAEKRVKSLKNLIQHRCTVRRGGKAVKIDPVNLVPGDIVLLEDGQSVPADLRVIESHDLTAIESSLTGESLPATKEDGVLESEVPLGDRGNMLYMGTSIASGECTAVVVATGLSTELGSISKQLESVEESKSLFYERSEKLMKQMIIISLFTTAVTIFLLLVKNYTIEETIQFSFATLISGIPEGLPSVLTILLSIASVRMSRRNALLRNLPAIETLSTVTTIITDKTGTLTQNIMSVGELMLSDGTVINISGEGWSDDGKYHNDGKTIDPAGNPELSALLEYCSLMSAGDAIEKNGKYELTGYPTEVARYVLAKKGGFTKVNVASKYKIIDKSPYDQETKYKSFLMDIKETGERILVVIGGAEGVLAKCKNSPKLSEYGEKSAMEGYRMQAVGYKQVDGDKIDDIKISDLTPLAVLRFSDPIRKGVPEAIKASHRAGIRVIMATGDHLATAFAIAKESGIVPSNAKFEEIAKYGLSQNDIDQLTDQEFEVAVSEKNIFARVTPATKLRIGEILQRDGEVIAMTGDGVNDAPVIKKADIGISMGLMGTDVAKEASDLVLLDDSFPTIIDAIEEGRTVFTNIRQTSLYLITTNLAEDVMIIVSIILGFPLPLLPIQILWLNLVTDGLSDIALATEGPHQDTLGKKPRSKTDGIVTRRDLSFILFLASFMGAISILAFARYLDVGIDKARTVAFSVMVFTQLFNVINMRSLDLPIRRIGYLTNRAINISIIISVLLFAVAVYSPLLGDMFRFEPISLPLLGAIILLSSSILILGEVYKEIRLRSDRNQSY